MRAQPIDAALREGEPGAEAAVDITGIRSACVELWLGHRRRRTRHQQRGAEVKELITPAPADHCTTQVRRTGAVVVGGTGAACVVLRFEARVTSGTKKNVAVWVVEANMAAEGA